MSDHFKNYFQMVVAICSYSSYDSNKTAENIASKFVWMKDFLEENRIPYSWTNIVVNGHDHLMLHFEKTSWSPVDFFEAEMSVELFVSNELCKINRPKVEKKTISEAQVLTILATPIKEDLGVALNSWKELEEFARNEKGYQQLVDLWEVSCFEESSDKPLNNAFVLNSSEKYGYLIQYYTDETFDFEVMDAPPFRERGTDSVFASGAVFNYQTPSEFRSQYLVQADFKILESRDNYSPSMGTSKEDNYVYDLAEAYNNVFCRLLELDGSGSDPLCLGSNGFNKSTMNVHQTVIHVDKNAKETQECLLKFIYMQSAIVSASLCYDTSLFPNAEYAMQIVVHLDQCPTICNPLVTTGWADKAFNSRLAWDEYYDKFLQLVKPLVMEKELKKEIKKTNENAIPSVKPPISRF